MGITMDNSAPEETLRYFKIEVKFDNPEDDGGPFAIPDGIWSGLAKDEIAGQAMAYDQCWYDRLDTTGCYPVYKTEEIQRYCSSEGWGHIFVGTKEETTRWVYDRGTKSMVAAQVLNMNSWVNLDAAPIADLLESIQDNDAVDDAETFDLAEWDHVPTWQEVESHLAGKHDERQPSPEALPAEPEQGKMTQTMANLSERQELITRLRAIGTQDTIQAADMIARDDEELGKAHRKYLDFSESAQRRADKLTDLLVTVDVESEALISVLDCSGSLEGENTQRAAYKLRLAVVRALGDEARVTVARESLSDLDASLDDDETMDFTVKIEVQVTANSPEEAACFALNDLRDESLGPWYVETSCSLGTKEVQISSSSERGSSQTPRG